MWAGGVRVVILDSEQRILMIRQHHSERYVWTVPGGAIEPGENAVDAAIREVREETGLQVAIDRMLWHVEQVVPGKDPRFVNVFLAYPTGGSLRIGTDPERDQDSQVIEEVRYLSRSELMEADGLYPEFLKDELWEILEREKSVHNPFKIRK
jgi:ADP-ribose pyrophosphatase YjhB (NUDIX family)